MADVRLTATNPEDSSVVPVACNAKGAILLEEPIAGEKGERGPEGPPGPKGEPGPKGDAGTNTLPSTDGVSDGSVLSVYAGQAMWAARDFDPGIIYTSCLSCESGWYTPPNLAFDGLEETWATSSATSQPQSNFIFKFPQELVIYTLELIVGNSSQLSHGMNYSLNDISGSCRLVGNHFFCDRLVGIRALKDDELTLSTANGNHLTVSGFRLNEVLLVDPPLVQKLLGRLRNDGYVTGDQVATD